MEHPIRLIPSIASADQLHIADEIDRVKPWELLHIDIEDGNFVPNITFGEKTVRAVSRYAPQQLDGHILANDPEQYLQLFADCGFKRAAAHLEALPYPLTFLNKARELGMRSGLALNFATPAEAVLPFRSAMDYVIVMTSEPDGKGQQFFPPVLEKISRLRAILPPETEIWADGGVNESNMRQVTAAGADTLIMGRCVFGSPSPIDTLRKLQENLRNKA
ncbi:MAG: ribulose-phosphate 3-epimerase [Flexilinea sp.]|nr:ribulose-phosphate 3-epimerase [Flexilinea sp.]